MLWELVNHGGLSHWWEWPVFIACMLVLVAGPTAIWLIMWATNPRRHNGED
jgi:hypothetical protein